MTKMVKKMGREAKTKMQEMGVRLEKYESETREQFKKTKEEL